MTSFTRRTVTTFLTPFLAFGLLASCSGGQQSPADKSAEAEVTLTALQMAIANPARGDNAKRDGARRPEQTLNFFQLDPSMTVLEISPGAGYYADILSAYLAAGEVNAESTPEASGTYMATAYPETSDRRIAANAKFKAKYPNAIVSVMGGEARLPEGVADRVLTFRNVHNWMGAGTAEDVFAQFYATLKPGGMLGVVEHRLPATQEQDPRAPSGYVQEAYVKTLASEAGFEFVASSEINANPKDTADHPYGVWTLPPRLRAPKEGEETPIGFGDYDKAAYEAIGESDRMTLLFKKV